MLAMVLAVPTGFGLLVWRSYRTATARKQRGDHVATPGAQRWEPDSEAGRQRG